MSTNWLHNQGNTGYGVTKSHALPNSEPLERKKSLRLILISAYFLVLSVMASAQEGQVLKEASISGWKVSKFQTPREGLSCQAFKCNSANCNVDTAEAVVRLWGSARRKAVTPMIGMKATRSGASNASLTVADQSFPLSQTQKSRGKLFIATRPEDDVKILRLMSQRGADSVTFSSNKGSATFRLSGANRVLKFFQRECGIPIP